MTLRTIALLAGLAAALASGAGIVKIKHGLAIGAVLVVIGYLLPDTTESTQGTTA